MMLYCDTLSVEKRYKYWMICSYQEKKNPFRKSNIMLKIMI